MRLFVAIHLSHEWEECLWADCQALKEKALQGNFTRRENLHLTLAFLGETLHISSAKRALHSIQSSPFSITLGEMGSFGKGDSLIVWRGIQPSKALYQLHKNVTSALQREGFLLEDRPFIPHFTLGRQVKLPAETHLAISPKSTMLVSSVDLIHSFCQEGKRMYRSVDSVTLQGKGKS